MLDPEVAEGLALVALVRAVRLHEGFGARLVVRCGTSQFAEVVRTRPVRHRSVRVIVVDGCYVSPFGVTPLGRVLDLMAHLTAA
ncbi:hypothetical protein ACFVH6_02175 [Spirillospora sp. NPDC127200]